MMISIGGGIFVEVEFLRYVSNILYEFDYIRTLSCIWEYRVELESDFYNLVS